MIVNNIDQIKTILTNLDSEMDFGEFATYMQDAEDWIESDILGTVIYEGLSDASIDDAKLKRFVETIIILKGYEIGIPTMDLVHTSTGFGVISDKSKAPASEHRVKKLIAGTRLRLNKTIERLINYLEDTPTFHTDWKSSPAYSLLSDCLIITAREFKRYVKFEGDRNEFLLLKPSIINKTSLYFHKDISKAYIGELISKQNAGTLSDADKTILPALKQSLANFTMDNELMGHRLLADVVTIMDKDLDNYTTYRDSEEKALKDSVGYENTLEDPIFVFKAGM